MKPPYEDHQKTAKLAGLAGAGISFFVVYNFYSFFAMNWFFGLVFGTMAAFFAFNYVPIHLLGRQDPTIFNPREEVYTLSPGDLLGRITKSMKIFRFQGYHWSQLDSDEKSNTLVYNLKFEEDRPTKDGVDKKNYEIILNIHAYQDPRTSEVTFLRLNFWETQTQLSISVNELIKNTTSTIYNDLEQYQAIIGR